MKLSNAVLFPFAIIYDGITRLRNALYDYQIFQSHSFNVPTIVIGNLSMGGTGKTPHTEYVAQLLSQLGKTAVLSRGYGRKTKGFVSATADSTAQEVGDEPLQIALKYPEISVAVCENRPKGIHELLSRVHPQFIVLDDAFQHRALAASLYILLTPYDTPFFKDSIVPAGRLRETAQNKSRAAIIVVTKCPTHLSVKEKRAFIHQLAPLPHQRVFFTAIQYEPPKRLTGGTIDSQNTKGILVTGIVNPAPLKHHLAHMGMDITLLSFPDHHDYGASDIQKILTIAKPDLPIFTTSKDMVKLRKLFSPVDLQRVFEVPIGPHFLFNEGPIFNQYIQEHVRKI